MFLTSKAKIMQKVINVLALCSFAVSAGVVAGGYSLYNNKEKLAENLKNVIIAEVTSSLSLPTTPETPAIPSPPIGF